MIKGLSFIFYAASLGTFVVYLIIGIARLSIGKYKIKRLSIYYPVQKLESIIGSAPTIIYLVVLLLATFLFIFIEISFYRVH